MLFDIKEIQQEFESKVQKVQDIPSLEELRVSFLGKKERFHCK
jgi:hypothetical protein